MRAEVDLLLVDGLLVLLVFADFVRFLVLVLGLMGRSPNLGMNLACRSICEKTMVCHGRGRGINVGGIFRVVGVGKVFDRRSEIGGLG